MIVRKPIGWYVILWSICFMSPGSVTASINTTCRCCKPLLAGWKDNYCLKISCSPLHAIVHLNATSGNDIVACNADDHSSCFAPTPETAAVRNFCYWQQNCFIPYPKDRLFPQDKLTSTRNAMRCVFKEPQFIRIFSARCAPLKGIYELKGKKKKRRNHKDGRPVRKRRRNENIVSINKRHQHGIIRSHPYFPWAYKKSMFAHLHEYNIVLKLRQNFMKKKVLLVGVRVLDICETEELTFKINGGQIGPIDEIHNRCTWEFVTGNNGAKNADSNATPDRVCNSSVQHKTSRLEIRLNGSNTSKGCEGFLVCFIVYKNSEKPENRVDVCDAVAEDIPEVSELGMIYTAVNDTDLCDENKRNCCCPKVSPARCKKALKERDAMIAMKRNQTQN